MNLLLTAYSDTAYSVVEGIFQMQVNPESYTRKIAVDYDDVQGMGTTGSAQRFRLRRPDVISFSFYLDGTGAISLVNVREEVEAFQQLTVKYNGSIHKPNDLRLTWGKHLSFNCVLRSLDIEYLRFSKSGDPTRALLRCEFHEKIQDDIQAAQNRAASPDLTQSVLAADGDTLDSLCYKVYGDSKYYLEVAKANNIVNFRKLTPGQRLLFPPLTN
jgi:Contractile injection system tube protein/Phage Tail Protein X